MDIFSVFRSNVSMLWLGLYADCGCREDCYVLSNLQAAGEQLSKEI